MRSGPTPATWDDADVQRLTAAQQAELRALGRGCGLRRAASPGDGAAEVERTYVVPAARGRGLSRLVLAGLEFAARARGWTVAVADFGGLAVETSSASAAARAAGRGDTESQDCRSPISTGSAGGGSG